MVAKKDLHQRALSAAIGATDLPMLTPHERPAQVLESVHPILVPHIHLVQRRYVLHL